MNHKSLKIVFFGNTKFSLIGAKIIHEKIGLSFIVTIEDSSVAKFAQEQHIPFLTTKKVTPEIIEQLKKLEPDFFIVEDYGLILPDELLEIPTIAPLNIHHSLLPKFRGPTPAPSAILAGEKVSGVSVIKMTDKVDAGDIYGKQTYELKLNETTESLLTKLNELGGNLIVDVINNFSHITPISQPAEDNNYTPRLTRQSGFVDLTKIEHLSPLEIGNWKLEISRKMRAYYPWPGVWTKMNLGGKDKIVKFLPEQKLQVEGKKPMSSKDFLNGYPQTKEVIEKLFN